jgi:nucleoside-diphosphate-sugar epimerase
MKVAVFGATGWIGSYVIKELCRTKEVEKIIIGTRSELHDIPNKVIYLSWVDLDNYDSITHLQFAIDSYKVLSDLIDKGVKDITVAGTCWEYGKVNGELSEDRLSEPFNNYSIAKDTLRRLLSIKGISLKWLRIFYVYGEGQKPASLIPAVESAEARRDESFSIPGWKRIRDYLHVEDAARYIVRCAIQDKEDGIINICSGKPKTLLTFLTDYGKEKKYKIKIEPIEQDYIDVAPDYFWGCIKKLNRIIR